MENVLPARRYKIIATQAAAALTKLHDHRPMVLERRRGSGGRVSRSFEKGRVRTLSRTAAARAGGALRAGHEHECERSGTRALGKVWLGPGRASPCRADAGDLPAISRERAWRIHRHQGRRRHLADGVVE